MAKDKEQGLVDPRQQKLNRSQRNPQRIEQRIGRRHRFRAASESVSECTTLTGMTGYNQPNTNVTISRMVTLQSAEH